MMLLASQMTHFGFSALKECVTILKYRGSILNDIQEKAIKNNFLFPYMQIILNTLSVSDSDSLYENVSRDSGTHALIQFFKPWLRLF